MGLLFILFLFIADSVWKNVLEDTTFLPATLSIEPGGVLLNVVMNWETLSAVPPWLTEISLNIGWGGLSAHGERVIEVDLSFLLRLSRGVRYSGNSELYSGTTGSGLGSSISGSIIASAINLASRLEI